ncbi:hypothetical protein [Deinococcus cellulosilyticus]|uniref:Uncharacterized protein n=1 Tax=Deinococcus cellulosilyticus (strain DSM 18568 / NBRC 106333 / KACC 11606 / 5516J-15) TaxID=1223518 RepID=A0A511N611_DEIC1|nr:hypothetical protein [Deinococcus cellulosilyticus]GEM48274.1 hypothetical protein DC3_39090 [Deinococcus cellulosilyticus NBRC 106333 = KACC 11606]
MTKNRRSQGRIRGHIFTVLGIISALIGVGMLVAGYYVKDVIMLIGAAFLVCCYGIWQYKSSDY